MNKNIISHFKTITEHRLLVMRYCFRIGLYYQGLTHDLSKYSPSEFLPGTRYYQGYRSPNDAERRDIGYSTAWIHHKGRNRHHMEYWTDYSLEYKDGMLHGVKMPLKYVLEMFCDRLAACRTYNGDKYTQDMAYNYFMKGGVSPLLHPETAKFLGKLLYMVKVKGEDYTIGYIRHYRKHHKDY